MAETTAVMIVEDEPPARREPPEVRSRTSDGAPAGANQRVPVPTHDEVARREEARKLAEAADATAASERRTSERLTLLVEVTGTSDTNYFAGLTENVSEGGVFIGTYAPPPIGAQVTLALALPGGTVRVDGVVCWLREDDDGSYTGCGVQFQGLHQDTASRVQTLLQELKRDPLLFEV